MKEDFSRRVVDRIQEFDDRSRLYSAVSPTDTRPFINRGWRCDVYNDQGYEGACVGFGWTHELCATPRPIIKDAAFAKQIYYRARQLDQWPGEDYDGTSVLAGAKAVQEHLNSQGLPWIGGYRWAFGIQDVLRVISYAGPVVLGIDWYNDMYEPDANHYITPTGGKVGGHCILAKSQKIVRLDPTLPGVWNNIDPDKSHVRLHNSWGTNYGDGGTAFIRVSDLNKLLTDGGEACIPFNRRVE